MRDSEIREKYFELIYAVGRKYEGETRHETALRYIQQAEDGSNEAACENSDIPQTQGPSHE